MLNLLRAGCLRLSRYRLFWLTMAVMLVIGCFSVHTKHSDAANGFIVDLASALFVYSALAPLAAAVVISMFTGGEFDCGAVRNKLAVGCGRDRVYLSSLILAAATGVAAVLSYVLPYGAGCLLLVGPSKLPPVQLAAYGGMTLASLLAWVSIFTFVTYVTGRKAAAAVACLLLFMALLVAGTVIQGMLDAPEFISGYEMSVNGQIVEAQPEPNPAYLQPAARMFWSTVLDLLPGGQSIQLSSMSAASPLRLTLCALGEALGFTLAGLALFRRKDLK